MSPKGHTSFPSPLSPPDFLPTQNSGLEQIELFLVLSLPLWQLEKNLLGGDDSDDAGGGDNDNSS